MPMYRIFFIIPLIILCANPSFGNPPFPGHRPLDIVYCEYMPFFFKGGNGELRGIFVDLWNLWSKKTGVPVNFSLHSWEESINQVRMGRADINAAIFYTPERDKYLDYSSPFFDISAHFYHHTDVELPPDLSGYKIGVVKSDYSAQYLKQFKDIEITRYISHERLIIEALNGKIDAFIMEDPVAMSYLAKHNGLKKIKKGKKLLYAMKFRSVVSEGNTALLSTVNKGLAQITPDEMEQIISSWTGENPTSPRLLPITDVTIATGIDQIPFHFVDEQGQVSGMIIDLWHLWAKKNNVNITFKSATWSESLKMVRDGRADIHAGCFYTLERDKYLDYATPLKDCDVHFFFHRKIFGLKNLEDLVGFKIGGLKKDFATDFVKKELPGAYIAEYSSNQALFDAVENGDVRVFVGDTPTALFYLAKKGLLGEYRHHPARPLYTSTYLAAVKQGNTKLAAAIQEGFSIVTAEERATIQRRWTGSSDHKTKDVIIIACEKAYPPFSMLNSEGAPSGMLVDLWQLWSKKIGKKIEFRTFTRPDAIEAVASGEADIHYGVGPVDENNTSFTYSHPFYQMPNHLFYRAGIRISGMNDLNGRLVGAVVDTETSSWLLTRLTPDQVKMFRSEEELIVAASNREIDVFAGPLHVMRAFFQQQGRMSEFEYHPVPLFTRSISAGLYKDNTPLLKMINAGMNAITRKEMVEIESDWISDNTLRFYKPISNRVSLTEHEKSWIQRHGNIRLGAPPDLPPFDFTDKDGAYMGIASDYIKILNERLGLHIDLIPQLTWSQVISRAKNENRGVDVISSAVRTEQMKRYMLFTNPYTSFPWAIITRRDAPLIGDLRDLYGKKTAVIKNYAMHERLAAEHPDIPLILVDSVAAGLETVSSGKSESYVGNLASSGYGIQRNDLTNLKVAASAGYDNEGISFAVRSDWPELVGILNKGIATISSPERDKIRQRWFAIKFEHGVNRAYILKIILNVSGGAVILFVLFFFWNRQMQKARDAAQAANNAKSEFLASLSHEIRTPMNVIMGMTDITLTSQLDADQKHNLKTARKAAGHLLELIEDILDLSKIEAGKIKVASTPFDLDRLMKGILSTYTIKARQKGIDLEFKKFPDVPVWIKGDPVRLRQILVNLIGNATKFTDNGFIKITIDLQPIKPHALTRYLYFTVQDTGIGIPPDKLDIIFDSFTRAGRFSGGTYSGTGLGLAICKKFVSLMGGNIHVESELDKGSTFILSLPFEAVAASEIISTAPDTKKSDPCSEPVLLNILLAEDSGPNAAVFQKFLRQMGHQVITVKDGEQVIQHLIEQEFDLVLMDVEMPKIDGLEAGRQVRNGKAGERNRHIPLIAITAHALDEYREKCKKAGMNDFLTKPVNFENLKNTINKSIRDLKKCRGISERKSTSPAVDRYLPGRHGCLDPEGTLEMLDNDVALLNEIYTIFFNESPDIVLKLSDAIYQKNMDGIFFAAHNLKGAADRIGAPGLRDLAETLGIKTKNGKNEDIPELFDALSKEYEMVMAHIQGQVK